ncbi:MAG: OmpH family outer membrane protein [candidate division Zixibacteria bacterium]|nr:OmpH family outer membrane protein [candidate division Zixibacteria bacterium]
MKKVVAQAVITMLLGILVWSISFSTGMAQQLKIGYVDIQRLKAEYKEYVQAQEKFNKLMVVWQAKADSMQKGMQELTDKLEKQNLLLSEQAKNEIREQLLVKQNEYQLFANQVMGPDGEAAQKEYELFKPLIDKINTVIKLVALKENYTYVLDSTAGTVLYAKDELDITSKVVAELNK